MLGADLFLQIHVLCLEPRFQGRDFLVGPLQRFGSVLALELSSGACGKYLENGDRLGVFRHRLGVEHGQVSDHAARGVKQRYAEVTLHSQVNEALVVRKEPLEILRVKAGLPLEHVLARRAGDVELEVLAESVSVPVRQRPRAPTVATFGDERMADREGECQMPHQQRKEVTPRD